MEELDQCSVILRNKIKEFCPPVHLSVLMRAYRMDVGKDVPFEQYGYSNPGDFLKENIPELTLVESDRIPGDYTVHLRNQRSESETSSSDASSSSVNLLPPSPIRPAKPLSMKPWTRKKSVPEQFKIFLTRILDQYPLGILARDFVDVFYKTSGSALSYKMYGYPGHLSMFKDLPDVFRIEVQSDNELKLFPLEKNDLQKPEDRTTTNGFNFQKSTSEHAKKSYFKPVNSAPLSDCYENAVKKWPTRQGNLLTVSLDGHLLVPTCCLASIIGMSKDNILLQLKNQGIDVRGVKFLSNAIPDHSVLLRKLAALNCPALIEDNGRPVNVISLVPFESCSFILSAFLKLPSRTQEQLEEIGRICARLEAM